LRIYPLGIISKEAVKPFLLSSRAVSGQLSAISFQLSTFSLSNTTVTLSVKPLTVIPILLGTPRNGNEGNGEKSPLIPLSPKGEDFLEGEACLAPTPIGFRFGEKKIPGKRLPCAGHGSGVESFFRKGS